MRWLPPIKAIGLSVCLLTFILGAYIDAFLRANVGTTCFGCSNLTCRIVTIADQPLIAVSHPIETADFLFETHTEP
jgi:hypothetical protein